VHPILVDLGFFEIRSYGFTLALSFLIGIYLAARRARRYGVNPQHVLDLSVYIIIAAVVGSRLLYVLFHLGEYDRIVDVFALWQGGATFYGGLILSLVVSYAFAHRKGMPFLQVADIFSPSLALGIGVTRIGCFLSGCCFGKPSTVPWAVTFPPSSPAGYSALSAAHELGVDHIGLHPTQLYSSAYGLLIMTLLLVLEPRLRKRGATFGALILLYGIARFSVDFFRYYEANAFVAFGLTFNQLVSVGLVATGAYLVVRRTDLRNVVAARGARSA
jgi:phosphatidylglycerol:prolipoprotein diacylglycerol transferase